ncbi:hypothetical protein [Agromyces bauzanensis]
MTEEPRQRVERAGTGRRARLTPAPDTDVTPEAPAPSAGDTEEPGTGPKRRRGSSDDERITRERPPHW